MFSLYVLKSAIQIRRKEPLVSNSINIYEVEFKFSADWDGLVRAVVFTDGIETVSMLLDGTNKCNIPWEVLQNANKVLKVGVKGTKKDGTVVLPTVWLELGKITLGVEYVPDESETKTPTPDVFQQLAGQIGVLSELITTANSSLVNAINELKTSIDSIDKRVEELENAEKNPPMEPEPEPIPTPEQRPEEQS